MVFYVGQGSSHALFMKETRKKMVSDSDLDEASARPVDVTQNITYKLVLLSNLFGRSVGKLYEQHVGLMVPEWRVISVVGTKGPLSLAELTQNLAVDRAG